MFWKRKEGERRAETLQFLAQAAVTGEVDIEAARELHDRDGDIFEDALAKLLWTVKGTGREALADLAESLDLVRGWSLSSRSGENDARIAALRRLAAALTSEAIEALNDALVDEDLNVRVAAGVAMIDAGGEAHLDEAVRSMTRGRAQRLLVDLLRSETAASPWAGQTMVNEGYVEGLRVVARAEGAGSDLARELLETIE